MKDKSFADIINLKGLIMQILSDYSEQSLKNPNIREEIADKVVERYKNLVKEISVRFLERESEKRSTIQTFKGLQGLK